MPVQIEGNLQLGRYPMGLPQLAREVAAARGSDTLGQKLEVSLDSKWYDITLLSSLSQMLWTAGDVYGRTDVTFNSTDKFKYFWQCGFWPCIRHSESLRGMTVHPSPESHFPKRQLPSLSSTPLIYKQLVEGESIVQQLVEEWAEHLSSTVAFGAVSGTNAIVSREYLFMLLWELVQNAQQHSGGDLVTVAGQLLIGQEDAKSLQDPLAGDAEELEIPDADSIAGRLANQHKAEVEYCALGKRKQWLQQNRASSFLLISCVDNGAGIPKTMAARYHKEFDSDESALSAAFDPDRSTRFEDPDLFDVHGLAQIADLLRSYRGYLFVQSGRSCLELAYGASPAATDHTGRQTRPIKDERALPGTLFQILLPLTYDVPHTATRVSLPKGVARPRKGFHAKPVVVLETLAGHDRSFLDDPAKWAEIAQQVGLELERSTGDPVFVDFVGLPPNRQFISYLLRHMRKRTFLRGMIVLNASSQLMAIASQIPRVGTSLTHPPEAGLPQRDLAMAGQMAEELQHLRQLDHDYANVLSRMIPGNYLPLLLPITSVVVEEDRQEERVQWLGLSGLADPLPAMLGAVLEALYIHQSDELSWKELWEHARRTARECSDDDGDDGDDERGRFGAERKRSLLVSIARCNHGILTWSERGLRLNFAAYDLYAESYMSLRNFLVDHLLPAALHDKGKLDDYLYSLSWHSDGERFRERFYCTWQVLSRHENAEACALLLLRRAYAEFGDKLWDAKAIVSVTPSAGILGREVARLLGVNFWETPSFYDISEDDWLPCFEGQKVLIVDDVMDCGSTSIRLIERLEEKRTSASCMGVLVLLKSEASLPVERPDVPFLPVATVNLGNPSQKLIAHALQSDKYFEVDPHTLDAVPPTRYNRGQNDVLRDRLTSLVGTGAIYFGHYVYGYHHYNIYFSLANAIHASSFQEQIDQWIRDSIQSFLHRNPGLWRSASPVVTVVYPYYSPVTALVNRLRARRFVIELKEERLSPEYAVAKPSELTGDRLAYAIEGLQTGATGDQASIVVFIDDGISSGGTLSSTVENLIDSGVDAVLALVFFDRIGLQPRRHLRRVSAYSSSDTECRFTFDAYLPVNLRSYYKGKRDCPECEILRCLEGVPGSNDVPNSSTADSPRCGSILSYTIDSLRALVARTVVGLGRLREPSLMTEDDVVQVILFQDAVYSDLPTSREVMRSLAGKQDAPNVALECIHTILGDRKLYRQTVDKSQIRALLDENLRDENLDSRLRARFVLHIPLWKDKGLALQYLMEGLPHVFAHLATAQGNGNTLDDYFEQHETEFAAVLGALRFLRSQFPESKWEGTSRDTWKQCFGTKPYTGYYGSSYLFELNCLFLSEKLHPVEQAQYLITNFVGTYCGHPESLTARIRRFYQLLLDEIRAEDLPRIPRALLHCLVHRIDCVQSHFMIEETFVDEPDSGDLFTRDDIHQLFECYDMWERGAGDPKVLGAILAEHFGELDLDGKACTIKRMLARLTPSVRQTVDGACGVYHDRTNRVAAAPDPDCLDLGDLADLQVFGYDAFLVRVLSHLLENPYKHWIKADKAKRVRRLELTLEVVVPDDHEDEVWLSVRDNNNMTQAEIKSAFHQNGGLSAQSKRMKEFEGELVGERLEKDGWNEFTMKLHRVYTRLEERSVQ